MLRIFKNVRHKHTWIKPEGYELPISVYNCTAKRKVPLVLRNKELMTWYTCGPTVYDSSHIGHASCYVKLDIIQRILREQFKVNIVSVMNITDIDDKLIRRAEDEKSSVQELAKFYERDFWEDLQSLNVPKPDRVVRVTDNMPVIIDFIQSLLENKQAYQSVDGSVYFDTGCYKGVYGKLQNIGESESEKSNVKRSPADFALWKGSKGNEPKWESNFGPGRPGWHIECSALAGTILGSNIDVHAGGIDLRFPHHENEEAQSCSYFSVDQWVNYWLHTGHLHLKDSVKMSKSLKNTLSIKDMLKTCKADTFRMACLMSHYSKNMEYSEEMLRTANNYLLTCKNFMDNCAAYLDNPIQTNLNSDLLMTHLGKTNQEVEDALKDDFDTASCVKSINNLMSSTNKMIHTAASDSSGNDGSIGLMAITNFVGKTLNSFGLNLNKVNSESDKDFDRIVDLLVQFRGELRQIGASSKSKEVFGLCDGIRDEMLKMGIEMKDRGKSTTWSR
ncbi:PREDICTED: cysteine--tRNA ligase, mitochondrial [Nicrophorus vespilloides]|uniref:cysteine--tRNA ligase n=1 Tax=Nicrophorus vespilloides TaxID=110193 RepID=A0ABM1MTG8_NICVS|nr:PREDICTED: cysteine--tRNA ligase, mitochondrial [Nicrophorus vespilloides]